jgi:hypothetical protein
MLNCVGWLIVTVLPSSSEWCSLVLGCVPLTMKAPGSFETSGNIFTKEHCETPKDLYHPPLFIFSYQSVCSKPMASIWSYTPTLSGILSDSCVVRKIFLQAQLYFIFRYVGLAVQWSIFGVRQILGWDFRLGHELPFLQVFPVYPTSGSCTVWDTDCALI